MYNGKHVRKRRLRWRKEFVLTCSIALLVIGIVGGSLAYLFTHTDPVINTFTPPTVDVDIDETLTTSEKSDVRFKNNSDFPVYMRAMLIINWEDAEGNLAASVPEGYSYDNSGIASGWVENGGYYYYTQAVPAGEYSTNLVDSIKVTAPENAEYFLVVDVLVETIQAEPEAAVLDAWGINPTTLG